MGFRPGCEGGREHRVEREREQRRPLFAAAIVRCKCVVVAGCVFSPMLLPQCWHGRLRHQRRPLRRGRPEAYPTLVATNRGPYVLYPLFCRYLNVVIRASCHFRLIRLPSSFLLESLEKRKKERKLGRKDGSERDRFRFNL